MEQNPIEKNKFKLVIGSHRKLEIGKVYNSMTDPDAILQPNQAFRVVGESNVDEWQESLRSFGKEAFEEQVDLPCPYYCEIQTD